MIYGRKPGNEIVGEPVGTSGSRIEFLSVQKKRMQCKKEK
jgi:hypothetical protein